MLVSCSKETDSEQPSHAPAVSLPVDPPRVQLIDAGTAPQQVMAFHDSGSSQDIDLAFSDAFTQGTGTLAEVSETPEVPQQPQVLRAHAHATTTGQRDIAVVLTQPTYSQPDRAEDARGIDGFRLGWTADSTGRASSVTVAAPTQASDSARKLAEVHAMKLVAQPIIFPTEPIGIGARWSVDNRVAGDSTLLRSTTYTLQHIDGDNVELQADIIQRPAVTSLPLNTAAGSELKVHSTQSLSTGTLRINLGQPLPTSGHFAVSTRVRYASDGSDTTVYQDFTSGVDFGK
ncbi:hypothetical protein CEPID_08270 [Corynebacterium epidermidicanis]|uniref:Uncharacterized protein n=2 Tax=Corynebacterium epidermidicanis TaxID=1050174 RepID=A0A0G3GQT8_9CORY|nr:hypothetical protein CEPID_08270 [Corynebacterium epidermidicanis]